MKYKQSNLSKNLLNEFLKSNLYIGLPKNKINKDLYSYLYGFRNNISILKINILFSNLRQILKLVTYLSQKNYFILFLGFPFWFETKWKKLEKSSRSTYKFFNEDFDLDYLNQNSKKIGLVFIFNNYSKTSKVLQITKKLCLPTSGFLMSNTHSFDYPIFANFKSKQSIFFFYYLLLNLLKKKSNV